MSITHPFSSAKSDGADSTLVRPSNWNAAHTVTDLAYSGYLRLGSASAPSNTTSGHLTAVAAFVPDLYGSPTNASAGTLTLHSTSHATKGLIWFGAVGYVDEAHSTMVLGGAGGNIVSPTVDNTNIQVYRNSSTNWAGMGADSAGSIYFVTGSSAPATRVAIGSAGGLYVSSYGRYGSVSAAPTNTSTGHLTVDTAIFTPIIYGSTTNASGGAAYLVSTAHATKGHIYLGASNTCVDINESTVEVGINVGAQTGFKLYVNGVTAFYGTSYIGSALGNTATPTRSTTNIVFYDGGSTNWYGLGLDSGGSFYFAAGNATTRLSIGATGLLRAYAYGAGTATFDASGNITSVSDERLKVIKAPFNRGLAALALLAPIMYKWNGESGLETEHEYAGFSAQNVQRAIPEAVMPNSEGYLSLQDRPIIATLVNAVNELAAYVKERV